jgi:hypothetical protein
MQTSAQAGLLLNRQGYGRQGIGATWLGAAGFGVGSIAGMMGAKGPAKRDKVRRA